MGDEKQRPGPEPETLKLEGDWKKAVRKALERVRPKGGWPKPKAAKKGQKG